MTPERLAPLARAAGFEGAESARYDRRLAVNRATQTRMYRVWLIAVLRKAQDGNAQPARSQAGGLAGPASSAWAGWPRPRALSLAAVALALALVWRLRPKRT